MAIGLRNFKVRINDRSILMDLLMSIGFKQNELASVCVIFDKLDKIGVDGIRNELSEKGFSIEIINSLCSKLQNLPLSLDYIKTISTLADRISNLQKIIYYVRLLSENKYEIEFDLSLVRGQGYYTGTVFEIESKDFNNSVAGGGRYDNLIGKFISERVPAVGFSIGFERIFSILMENGFSIPNDKNKIAILFEDNFLEANKQADEMRYKYDVALFERPKKLNKLLNSLQEKGFYGFIVYGQSADIKILNND